jgi:hypothetical protein
MFRASTAYLQEVRCMYVANGTSKMTVSEPGWNGTTGTRDRMLNTSKSFLNKNNCVKRFCTFLCFEIKHSGI